METKPGEPPRGADILRHSPRADYILHTLRIGPHKSKKQKQAWKQAKKQAKKQARKQAVWAGF
jgi:hypothetical protein